MQETWVDRAEVLTLFWPEESETKARQSLRTLLYKAKQETWGAWLEVTEERVRCLVTSDVSRFQEALASGNWQAAVQAYGGTFLERVKGDDSAAFEDWLQQSRDALHLAWRDAAVHVAEDLASKKAYGEAITLLQKVLAYDFLAEEVVQLCMRLQALAGHKTHALATFESFRKQLQQELEMEPLETTFELAAAIRQNHFKEEASNAQPKSLLKPPVIPQPLTPFVGRTLELLELANLLAESETRLITLLGPGGMGKTRLALQVMSEQARHFKDGVACVLLAPLSRVEDIPDAVASVLPLDLSGGTSVADEVLHFLKDKEMLLVLDNFEHLLEGAPFVTQLLEAAPKCKYLVTSRVLLGMTSEIVYDVSGLTLPATTNDSNIEAYDAAQLFLRSARRVRSDFSVSKTDYPALFELCKTLDGMPLALELAANWVRLFSLPDLLAEIQKDIDLLETTGQEVSERHQSLRKVFEYSWQRLTPEEQRSLAALSVFHGGFSREAASAVTRVSAKTLLALVNKSLVRVASAGRFFMLEVIRQYAAEKLAHETAQYQEQHGTYYLGFVAAATEELKGTSPKTKVAQLERDLENIRLAWHWALQTQHFDLCLEAIGALRTFLTATARFQEGIAFCTQALANVNVQAEPKLLANLYLELAYFSRRLDQYRESNDFVTKALQTTRALPEMQQTTIAILCELAHIQTRVGNFTESLRYAKEALRLAEGANDSELIVLSRSRLALAKRFLGNFDEARHLYELVLAYERQRGHQLAMLRTLSDFGRLYNDLHKPYEARALFSEGLELAQSQNLPYELAFMWEGLSQCSYLLADYAKARQQAEQALAQSETVNDMIGVAVQCANLANMHLALKDSDTAQSYLRRALEITWKRHELPDTLKIFLIWAKVFRSRKALAKAAELLSYVSEHPASEFIHKQEARGLLQELGAATRQGPNQSLEAVVSSLLQTP